MDDIVNSIRSQAQSSDEHGRKEIRDKLLELYYSLETPFDIMQRLCFQFIQTVIARVGCDLKLFTLLCETKSPMTTHELAQKLGVAPTLMGRLLRYMASVSLVEETGKNCFGPNKMSQTLSLAGVQGGIHYSLYMMEPQVHVLPEFLKKRDYQDVVDPNDTPFHQGLNTTLTPTAWVQESPERFLPFNQFMTVQRMGMASWLDVYPYARMSQDLGPDEVLFVDVGGGLGHQSIALRDKLPNLPNKIVVQDLPAAVDHFSGYPGVETMVQDFWQAQTIHGGRMYYLRNILHNYPDEGCIQILENIKSAVGPKSVILIDEMVIPNTGAHWQATQLDMVMMCTFAAMERTQDQWHNLIDKAGLTINNKYVYTATLQHTIIECTLASTNV